MRVRRVGAVLAALALAACEGQRGGAETGDDSAAPAASPLAVPPPAAEAPPLDSAGLAAAMADEDSLDAYNRRSFEERRRSMGSYEQCLAQGRELPPEMQARIEAACETRREGS